MKYEKPRLIKLGSSTAMGGDCVPTGSLASTKCQAGAVASQGDCDNGTTANICKKGGLK